MTKYKFLSILLIIGNTCFGQKAPVYKYDKIAVKLNDSAVQIVFKGSKSKESYLKAIKLLDSATKIEHNDPVLYSNKIQYLTHLGRFSDALKQNENLAKIEPNSPSVIATHGLILHKLSKEINARKDYKIAYQLCKKQYMKNHKVSDLENLAFATYLVLGRDSATNLMNKEKHYYKDDQWPKRELNDYMLYIFPKLNADNALSL